MSCRPVVMNVSMASVCERHTSHSVAAAAAGCLVWVCCFCHPLYGLYTLLHVTRYDSVDGRSYVSPVATGLELNLCSQAFNVFHPLRFDHRHEVTR